MNRLQQILWTERSDDFKRATHTFWQSAGAVFITSILVSVDKIDLTDFNAIGALLMSAFVGAISAGLSALKGIYVNGKLR